MIVFCETDDRFIYVVIWNTDLEGYWSGYVGYKNPKYKINVDKLYFHGGETNAIQLSDFNINHLPNSELFGFNTIHHGDNNIGPQGEQGIFMHEKDNLWTREVVLDHLINVVSSL